MSNLDTSSSSERTMLCENETASTTATTSPQEPASRPSLFGSPASKEPKEDVHPKLELPALIDTSRGLSASLLDLLYPFVNHTSPCSADFGVSAGLRPFSFTGLESLLKGPKVTILVGSEKAKFILPKILLSEKSPFFCAAFNGSWSETRSSLMELPDADPDSFKTIAINLITGNFTFATGGNNNATDFVEYRLGLMPLIKVHILASKLLLPKVEVRAYDEFAKLCDSEKPAFANATRKMSQSVSPDTFRYILDETTDTSFLRKRAEENLWFALSRGLEHVSTYSDVITDHPTIAMELLERFQDKLTKNDSLKARRKREIAEAEAKRQTEQTPSRQTKSNFDFAFASQTGITGDSSDSAKKSQTDALVRLLYPTARSSSASSSLDRDRDRAQTSGETLAASSFATSSATRPAPSTRTPSFRDFSSRGTFSFNSRPASTSVLGDPPSPSFSFGSQNH